MAQETPALLLRIYLDEGDKYESKPLYEALVLRARDYGLAGATVLRGPLGFGSASEIHTAKILRLSEHLPMVVEMVDSEEQIRGFVEESAELLHSALVTLEKVSRWQP